MASAASAVFLPGFLSNYCLWVALTCLLVIMFLTLISIVTIRLPLGAISLSALLRLYCLLPVSAKGRGWHSYSSPSAFLGSCARAEEFWEVFGDRVIYICKACIIRYSYGVPIGVELVCARPIFISDLCSSLADRTCCQIRYVNYVSCSHFVLVLQWFFYLAALHGGDGGGGGGDGEFKILNKIECIAIFLSCVQLGRHTCYPSPKGGRCRGR